MYELTIEQPTTVCVLLCVKLYDLTRTNVLNHNIFFLYRLTNGKMVPQSPKNLYIDDITPFNTQSSTSRLITIKYMNTSHSMTFKLMRPDVEATSSWVFRQGLET